MDPYYASKPRQPSSRVHRRSGSALFSLVLLGCGVVFFGIVMIACSFVINYADDFETSDGKGVEAAVQGGFSYSQYWAGIPFLVTGVLVICSGTFQRNRGLTITTAIFALISVGLTLFVVSLDGSSWHFWNAQHRRKIYWDSKSGVDCATNTKTSICVCNEGTTDEKFYAECDEISELSSLYGAVVGSSIVVAMLCIFSVMVITKSLSWKRIRYTHRGYYSDDFHLDTGRPPSVVELPYAKRSGEYLEPGPTTGPPYKQTVYRNYPY